MSDLDVPPTDSSGKRSGRRGAPRGGNDVNRRIRSVAVFILVIYAALFVKLNQIQVLDADKYNRRADNSRTVVRDMNRERGTIFSADGQILAKSEPTPDGRYKYQRNYPQGDLFAQSVGTFSVAFGSDGVERSYTDQLSGKSSELQFPSLSVLWDAAPNVGNVTLTLDSRVQQAAKTALGDRKGSVVAIDPRNGSVLALWSFPSFDPNPVVSNDIPAAKAAREALDASPDKPRLAKSFRDRYFPGSTFKIVTAGIGLQTGKVTNDQPAYPVERGYTAPLTNRAIANFDRSSCGGTLADILRVSCNSAFARMGTETLGPQAMIDGVATWGIGEVPPLDIPGGVSSVFPNAFGRRVKAGDPGNADVFENSAALAQSSIGQNDVSTTPLQMALVAAGVANRGTVMAPHVLSKITDVRGREITKAPEKPWKQPLTPENADVLRADLLGVVQGGTAKAMAIPGMEVGGKTGTAQLGTTPPKSHAWIVGFAGPPGQASQVAVAVLVEGQEGASEQTGGRVAAPIAKAVMQAALAR
jgi:peptidoglycan glycosyltransferase